MLNKSKALKHCIAVLLGILLLGICSCKIRAADESGRVRRANLNGPTFSRILDQTIDEDTSSIPSLFAVASSSSVTISRNSSNTDLVPNANIFISFTDPLWQVFVTPATNQFGTATITLTAEDANSVSGTTEFRVTVNPVADPVTVRLISPSQNQVFLAPATVELIAEAADPDGRIVSIDFFQGSKLIERVLSQPYTSKWTDVTPDDYSLTAVATDDAGNLVASDPVVVSVRSQLVGPRRQVDVVEGDLNSSRSVQIPILGLPLQAETITYWTSDGPGPGLDQNAAAIEGRDYLPIRPTELTLNADTLRTTVDFVTLGDELDERNELFFVNWSSPNPGFLVSNQLVVNIIDDDPSPFVSIDDVQVREGGGEAVFTLTLSTPSARDVFVEYTTEGGSAIEGKDYVSAPILATIRKAFSSTKITVPILNDALDEPNETFFVNLGRTENIGIAKGRGQATILDDDEPPNISVREATPAHDHEDPSQNTDAVFTVALSSQSGFPISVDYGTVDDTALAGSDYEATSGTLAFDPGDTNQLVVIPTLDDVLSEAPEIFFLRLSNPTNVTLTTSPENRAIIFDSDPLPSLSISPASVLEPDSGSTNAVFEVTLSAASGQIVSVGYSTSDVTATAGSDYAEQSDTLVFEPGQVSKVITVPVLGDTRIETSNELFFVNLLTPENAIIASGQTFGIIIDNEPITTVSIGDASIVESNSGFVNAVFTVRLAEPIDRVVSVDFWTANDTALSTTDYAARFGTLVFLPQETEKQLFIQVLGDRLNEADERFRVILSNAVEVLIEKGGATGIIVNDDPVPSVLISDVSVLEGDTGTTNAVFRARLSAQSGKTVSFRYGTANATANIGSDLISNSGTLTIPPGDTEGSISVTIIGDTDAEPDEIFMLQVFDVENATLKEGQATGTILNDDSSSAPVNTDPTISPIGNQNIVDGQASSPVIFTINDEETVLTEMTIEATSSDLDLIPVDNIVFGGSGANRSLVLVPTIGQSGTATITVIVFDSDGLSASTSFEVTVLADGDIPAVTWAKPSDIPYGVPLDANQLNAAVNLPDVNPVYDPSTGTVLQAGSAQSLTVTFERADGTTAVSESVTINVLKANLRITADDQTRPYREANPQLNVSYSGFVNGDEASDLISQPEIGASADIESPVGLYPIEVSGATSDNYEIRFVPGVLTVTRVTPTIDWENPADIVFGTELTSQQLNAASSAPGEFSYDPQVGAILAEGEDQILKAFFVPKNRQNYEPAIVTVSINVTADQPISAPTVKGDLNSDGLPDLIFQDDSGSLAAWLMEGPALTYATLLNPSAVSDVNYRVAASGDFNTDGNEDLLFQHKDGTLAVWYMNGTTLTGADLLKPANPGDSNWRVTSIADLNGDTNVDLVFQHTGGTLAVWFMDGINLVSASLMSPSQPGNEWRVAGTGDFNNDKLTDLLFQHDNGTLAVWYLNGADMTSAALLTPSNPGSLDWRVVSVVDRNQDGQPDLLFQNSADGTLAIWYMDGVTLDSAELLNPTSPGGTWKVVAPR